MLVGSFAHASLIWTEKSLAVEMYNVRGRLSDPYLGLPRDFGEVLRHGSSREKRGHENQASPGPLEEVLQLVVSLEADGAMTRDSLNEEKPFLFGKWTTTSGILPCSSIVTPSRWT